jgi:acyl carrier protein
MNEAMLKEVIIDALRQIAPDAEFEQLRQDENIREALDIDSFDHLNFLISLHKKLGVDIPEADYGRLNTLEEITSYLTARVIA